VCRRFVQVLCRWVKSPSNVAHAACSSYPSINGHVDGAFTLPEDLADMGVRAVHAVVSRLLHTWAGVAHRVARAVAVLRLPHSYRGRSAAVFHEFRAAVVQVRNAKAAAPHAPSQLHAVLFDLMKHAWHLGALPISPFDTWCNPRRVHICTLCRSDIHAPDSTRVNAALSQMEEFSSAFLSAPPSPHPTHYSLV
jgi:hypothetical protein